MNADPLPILRSVFGYDHFRAPQEEVIATLLAGGDALVLMPTGGGKSLCFQIPAIARPGTGIVVSPLIALMHDQVAALTQAGVRAAFLNSTLTAEAARAIETRLLHGDLDLLYVSPERLMLERTLDLLAFTALAAALAPFAMGAVSDAYHSPRYGFVLATGFELLLALGLGVNALSGASKRRLHDMEQREYTLAAPEPLTPGPTP